MATELAVSYVSIVPSLKGFKGIVSKELGSAEKSASASGKAMGNKMGGSFASSLKRAVGPALAVFGAGAIAGFAKQAVGAFSELEDSTAAAGVVFGDNMKQIIAQSKTAAKSMGLTQQQVINAANTFGTYGKAAGLSGKALADFATGQTQLAADMASFKGTSPEQAIEAIGAALRGETEPIRAYGVLLDDASLRQEALAMGLISTTKDALSPQNKTLAAQALILKQTADAQGDFARTADSTANIQKTLSASVTDVSAKLGSVMAPAFTAARTKALGAVQGVGGLLDKVLAFQGALTAGAMTPDLVKAIGLDPEKGFGRVVGEGIGSIRAFGAAWTFNDGQITSSGLAGYMEGLAYRLRTFLDTASRVGKEVWATLGPALIQLGPPVLNLVMALSPLGIVLKALAPVLPDLADSAAKLAVVVAGVLTSAITFLTPIISGIVSGLAVFVSGLTSTQEGADVLKSVLVAGVAAYVAYKVGIIASTIATNAQTLATKAATIAQKGMNLALKANPIGIVITAIAALVAGIIWFATETETGRKIVQTAWQAIKVGIAAVPGAFEKAKQGIAKAWNAIQDIAKKPVRFVVERVINDGLIGTFNKIPGVNIPKIKLPRGFAKGGYASPGWAMVGEEGPELVNFSQPGRVYTAKQSASMLGHAARIDSGPSVPGAFMGNRNAIAQHGAYYLKTAAGMGPWNFPGAARMWDGAAGVRVRMGTGQHQGFVSAAERGGGILGYTTGTNIDMSPSWMARLGATQRRTVAAHEIGHALGLPHMGGNSIMAAALGNMASVPTSQDVRMLQRLYPGGTGKAGSGAPENPFAGMVGSLMEAFKKAFPGAGMFVDAAGGLAKSGIESVVKFVSDIAGNIGKIVGDITGGVVDGIRNFFGGGAAMLHDQGGVLQPGLSTILNKTGKPEAILNQQQWSDISKLALSERGGRPITIQGNVGWDPAEVARRIETAERRQRITEGVLV